jgi:hypothetical protein
LVFCQGNAILLNRVFSNRPPRQEIGVFGLEMKPKRAFDCVFPGGPSEFFASSSCVYFSFWLAKRMQEAMLHSNWKQRELRVGWKATPRRPDARGAVVLSLGYSVTIRDNRAMIHDFIQSDEPKIKMGGAEAAAPPMLIPPGGKE